MSLDNEMWNEPISQETVEELWNIDIRSKEAKAVDEYIENFYKVDSEIVIANLEELLFTNPNELTLNNKLLLDASIIFILEKFWTLYPKELAQYKWRLLWYGAFWWSKNDEIYNKTLKDCEINDTPLDEEVLIIKMDNVSKKVTNALFDYRNKK